MLIYPKEKIYSFYYDFPKKKWKSIYDNLVQIHMSKKSKDKNKKYKDEGYNFLCSVYSKEFEELYNFFLDKTIEILGNVTLLEENSTSVWANVSGRNELNEKHDHLHSSVVNSVYYFSQPNDHDGGIDFFGYEKIHHQPKQGELLIFPNYLPHLPYSSNSDQYRIALNMEILCKEKL